MSPGSLDGPFGRRDVWAPTAHQAAHFDRFAIRERGVPEPALMENAGRQAALIVQHLFSEGPVVALAGSGNNGGDALVCLRALAAWGRSVTAVTIGDRPVPDTVLHGWELPCLRLDPDGHDDASLARLIESAGVVVDGLLGTGIKGAPRARYAAAIEAANRARGSVVALDTPSGVDGATGSVAGAAIRAELTIAFGWPKLGTLLHPGRACCGRIVAVEIGFPPGGGEGTNDWAELATSGWAARRLPRRPPVTHKNAVGTLAVVAGSAMPGAAVLAARAAFRAGAGLVRVCASRPAGDVVAEVPEAVFVDSSDAEALRAAVQASDAVVVGPGLGSGDAAARQLELTLSARGDRPAVVDADALTLLARGVGGGMRGLEDTGAVVTPHPGEMSRLTGTAVAAIQAGRIGTARDFAAAHGVVTLLKGAPSLVAGPHGGLLVSTTEHTSALAVAGMGDVLAGAAGSFLAQGSAPIAACGLALYVTGRAAADSGLGASLMPSDVLEGIPRVLSDLADGAASGRDRPGAGGTSLLRAVPATGTDLPFPFVTFDQARPR